MTIVKEGNVKWVDGLRGIGSILVVVTHICRAWDDKLFEATTTERAAPRALQLPYLRVLTQGRIGVAIFAFVGGYVCALKPIRLCKAGNQEAALAAISKSALRRIPRLVLPAAFATLLSLIICELGLFAVAKNSDSWWIDTNSPVAQPWLGAALANSVYNVVTTWTKSLNRYDVNQWTLLPLLRGSIWVYAFIMATVNVKPRYRMMLSFALWGYFWCAGDAGFGMQFFWGALIADLQTSETVALFLKARPGYNACFSFLLVFLGLTLASFPEFHPEWMTWSKMMLGFLVPILPEFADVPRFASGFGLEFISLGIVLNPLLQKLLSSRYLLFLGRMSFAVYLLHATLLKTALCWMLYGFQTLPDHENENGEMVMTRLHYPGHLKLLAWQIVFLPLLYGVASLWMAYVDSWCERITNKFVDLVRLEPSEKIPVLPILT